MICGSRIGCGEVIGQDFGLLPQGCDQSVHLAAVLRAFPVGTFPAGAVLARREGDLARKALFVARVRRPVPAPALRHLFPGVILDGGDPERAFVEARLRALGLPFVTHDPAPAEGPVDPDRRLERFEETRGVRLIETARPSRRACMELLAAAQALFGEVAAPFAPPMPPAIDPALFTGVPGGRA